MLAHMYAYITYIYIVSLCVCVHLLITGEAFDDVDFWELQNSATSSHFRWISGSAKYGCMIRQSRTYRHTQVGAAT